MFSSTQELVGPAEDSSTQYSLGCKIQIKFEHGEKRSF